MAHNIVVSVGFFFNLFFFNLAVQVSNILVCDKIQNV